MKSVFRARAVSVALGGVLGVVTMFGSAAVAQAAPLTSVQVDSIVTLLQAFGADAATVANVQAALTGTTPSVPASTTTTTTTVPASTQASSVAGCAVLSGNLQVGSEGGDVTKLQTFLSKDKTVYPEGIVSGYFGKLTEDAVRRWQAAHNVVATGTAASTGFGMVGPQTRGEMDKEMELECEHGDSSSSQGDKTATTSTDKSGDSTSAATSTSSDGGN